MLGWPAVAAKQGAALGFNVHTGRAVVVAVGGAIDAPEILAKTHIQVAFTFEEGAVFHAGRELPIENARTLVRDSEIRLTERARAEVAAFAKQLDAKVVAAGMVAPTAKQLPPFESILKAHPLVHAAEGELYRRVFTEAGAAIGARPTRVPLDGLDRKAAAAAGLTPAKLATRLAAMGKASGKPWAADQKQAALVAWLTLATYRA
jgi:hypothetical protein